MIQFNLLPDVKLEFIKAQRTKRLVISVSVIASVVAVAILIILVLSVDVLQRKSLSDLNGDIKQATAKVKSSSDLDQVLTIQNQLGSLTTLHDQKPVASRLFSFMGQVTPSTVTISNMGVDFTMNTITLTGNAGSIDNINTYVDTLKFTTYTTADSTTPTKAFSNVVLSSFGREAGSASYTINLNVDPAIFSSASDVSLTVPNTVTTRSITGQPTALFKQTETSKQ